MRKERKKKKKEKDKISPVEDKTMQSIQKETRDKTFYFRIKSQRFMSSRALHA